MTTQLGQNGYVNKRTPTLTFEEINSLQQEQDPLTQDPQLKQEQDPLTQDPLTQDPLTQDPLTQDPLTQDPLTQDPLTQEQEQEQEQDPLTTQESVLTTNGESDNITLTLNKSVLKSLSQNININLLVNLASYKNVLTKLKDNEADESKKNALEINILKIKELEFSVTDLFESVQTNLDIPSNQIIDPENIVKDSSFMQKLLGAESAAILGSMATASVLMLGGRGTRG